MQDIRDYMEERGKYENGVRINLERQPRLMHKITRIFLSKFSGGNSGI